MYVCVCACVCVCVLPPDVPRPLPQIGPYQRQRNGRPPAVAHDELAPGGRLSGGPLPDHMESSCRASPSLNPSEMDTFSTDGVWTPYATAALRVVTMVRQRKPKCWATSGVHTSSRMSRERGCCSEKTTHSTRTKG